MKEAVTDLRFWKRERERAGKKRQPTSGFNQSFHLLSLRLRKKLLQQPEYLPNIRLAHSGATKHFLKRARNMARSAGYKNTACNDYGGLVAPKVLGVFHEFIVILRRIDHILGEGHPLTQGRDFTVSRLEFFVGLVIGVKGHTRLLSALESTSAAMFGGRIVVVDGAGCRRERADGGLELGAVEERVGGGSDAGRVVVVVGVVLARKVSPFGFLADDPAGQTEAAGVADHVARAIFLHNPGGGFFAFGAGFVVGQVLDPGLFQRLLGVEDRSCSVGGHRLSSEWSGHYGVCVHNIR